MRVTMSKETVQFVEMIRQAFHGLQETAPRCQTCRREMTWVERAQRWVCGWCELREVRR